jgi:predicted TIM-barrel enzyme
LIGSGTTADNLDIFISAADGFIVGTYFKVDGKLENAVDPQRVERFSKRRQQLISQFDPS